MKKIILASISILIFCIFSFGQEKENSPCPSGLSVTGPSGLPEVINTFTAEVKNPENHLIQYYWTVSGGEINGGQGTSAIEVFQPEESLGGTVVATVELIGLPDYCGKITGSESLVTYCPPNPTLVDQISPLKSAELSQEFKDRLDSFAVTLLNNPNATGYFLGRFGKNKSELSMKIMLDKMILYLTKVRNFDASRLKFATAESKDDEIIQFWIVPPGAELPKP